MFDIFLIMSCSSRTYKYCLVHSIIIVSPVSKSVVRDATKPQKPPSDLVPLGPPKVKQVDASGKAVTVTGADEGIKVVVLPKNERLTEQVKIQSFNPLSKKHVKLPPGMKFVSPIYNITASTSLQDRLSAEIQHYADLNSDGDISTMSMLYSSDESPPYCFSCIKGGMFLKDSNFGIIQINSFGYYAVGASKGILTF